jgi:putative ABC transport system permease protein
MPQKTIENTTGHSFTDTIADFYILRDTSYDSEKVCKAVIDYLETAHYCKGKEIYTYYSFDDIMKSVNSAINLITVFVSFVASVSLVVGGIGVMNIMLVSVTERTREIGIRKALGAKNKVIEAQFLVESVLICAIGGILGILFGLINGGIIAIVAKGIVSKSQEYSFISVNVSPPILMIVISFLFSTLVGIVFGLYPARRAARLSPIDALRYE